MGMSASQARLIALTARMSDTEYEAQQINQQRLTLSNKMNEVYESLINMDVPTPPSKADYAKTVYKGKLGTSDITIKPNATGKMIAYAPKSGTVVDKTMGTTGGKAQVILGQDVNLKTTVAGVDDKSYSLVGDIKDADFFIDIDTPAQSGELTVPDPKNYQIATREEITDPTKKYEGERYFKLPGDKEINEKNVFKYDEIFDSEGKIREELDQNLRSYEDTLINAAADENNNIYYKTVWNDVDNTSFESGQTYKLKDSNEVKTGEDLIKEQQKVTNDRKCAFIMNNNGEYSKVEGEALDNAIKSGAKIYIGVPKDNPNNVDLTRYEGIADNKAGAERGFDSLDGMYVVESDGTCRPLTADDCALRNGKYYINSELQVKEQSTTGVTYTDSTKPFETDGTVTNADGKSGNVVDFNTAKAKYGDDPNFKLALEGLQHTYSDAFDANGDMKTEDGNPVYSVVAYPDGTFAFVLTSDYEDGDGDIGIYEPGKGKYSEPMDEGTYKIIYDVNGSPSELKTSDGARVVLEQEVEYDEFNFSKDTAKYTAQKNEYDREQNRLNKQTSIYQRQDKQLELKLTRLDNERNALNTEIESVKKVIQDSIDKGFKTFSG